MLNENLKTARKAKGLSQEELALHLNVVRQTVSKWEQGLSVPDSEMLLLISKYLETPMHVLLGENIVAEEKDDMKIISEKLELICAQLAKKKQNQRKFLHILCAIIFAIALLVLIFDIGNLIYVKTFPSAFNDSSVSIIGGADRPTSIMVFSATNWSNIICASLVLIASLIAFILTRVKK